ncbi:MAG: hypothetical protein AB7N91_02190 [Candidatus Tectimicrobiota bacterium]
MSDDATEHYTDAECKALFASLFPQGFAGPDVLHDIAPAGWEHSPLLAVCHPSLEQVYAEALRMHHNLRALSQPAAASPPSPAPTREAVAREYRPAPVETEREVGELVGCGVWDNFSHNHDVLGPDGRLVHIGSFRGAGSFIADCLNRQRQEEAYDYMDFYMGTIWIAKRADLTPVYEMIFRRLQAHGLDWRYAFPRVYMMALRPRHESGQADAEEAERQQRLAQMQAALDTAHREAVQQALDRPLPATVLAYERVYGRLPQGWPPAASIEEQQHDE